MAKATSNLLKRMKENNSPTSSVEDWILYGQLSTLQKNNKPTNFGGADFLGKVPKCAHAAIDFLVLTEKNKFEKPLNNNTILLAQSIKKHFNTWL